ncbi:helix-turn-helix domain-containing protein [Spongiimicrobium sp. 3-5]|uniref:helix-turn-helix domain-containing protein n=1 Tax=Spongiimicrobium sp. 3-5 TaxID=3332596 RepID=UPI00398161DB
MVKDHWQFDLYGKKIFEKVVVSPPFRFFYSMPDEACFYYICQGKNRIFAPTGKVEVDAEEGLVMQCGNYLGDILSSQLSEHCEAIAIHLPIDVLRMIYDTEFPDFLLHVNRVKPMNYSKYKSSELLKNYIDSLQFYFSNPSLVNEELLKLKLKELVLLLARTNNAEAVQQLLASMFTSVEVAFKEVVEANLYNNLTTDELAKLTSLSLSSFKREFAKHYKTSPAKYIRGRKLRKARKLLLATDLRVSEVAFDCGFTDLAHFSKSFHKSYQCSPTEYRLNLTNKPLD